MQAVSTRPHGGRARRRQTIAPVMELSPHRRPRPRTVAQPWRPASAKIAAASVAVASAGPHRAHRKEARCAAVSAGALPRSHRPRGHFRWGRHLRRRTGRDGRRQIGVCRPGLRQNARSDAASSPSAVAPPVAPPARSTIHPAGCGLVRIDEQQRGLSIQSQRGVAWAHRRRLANAETMAISGAARRSSPPSRHTVRISESFPLVLGYRAPGRTAPPLSAVS
jgi:hypothetical protein